MSETNLAQQRPLGVFTSVDAGFGVRLDVAKQLGVPTMHLHAPHQTPLSEEAAAAFSEKLSELGIQVTVVFAGFEGESYADIPTVQETVGLAPKSTRASRVAELKQIIDFTSQLNVDATGLHIGFVPHDAADPEFLALVATLQELCDYAAQQSVHLHLETGQEPADVLLAFLESVDRSNLWVNFDPANMILYGCGEPIPALRTVAPHVRSVHCKDARGSDQPGVTWGEETPLGEGDVDFREFLATLDEIGYQGPLTIEREISQDPERQQADIGAAIAFLNGLMRPE